jgi:hypothetical protein
VASFAFVMGCGPTVFDDEETVESGPIDVGACEAMDIVFVIDDSPSMTDEQENLIANFPAFVSVLDRMVNGIGEKIDYRVAVTTSAVSKSWEQRIDGLSVGVQKSQQGDDGAFRQTCGMDRPWLEAGRTLDNTFGCLARVGDRGPDREMHLEAMRLAFGDRVADGKNAGFVRDDALLAAVIITDENDCSRKDDGFVLADGEDMCDALTPVSEYAAALEAVKGDRTRYAVSVIAGLETGTCRSLNGSADEATRLIDFAEGLDGNASLSSICEDDLSLGLATAVDTFAAACRAFTPVD